MKHKREVRGLEMTQRNGSPWDCCRSDEIYTMVEGCFDAVTRSIRSPSVLRGGKMMLRVA